MRFSIIENFLLSKEFFQRADLFCADQILGGCCRSSTIWAMEKLPKLSLPPCLQKFDVAIYLFHQMNDETAK